MLSTCYQLHPPITATFYLTLSYYHQLLPTCRKVSVLSVALLTCYNPRGAAGTQLSALASPPAVTFAHLPSQGLPHELDVSKNPRF